MQIQKKVGDAVEKAGDKLEHLGFKKTGDAIEKIGDAIEHLEIPGAVRTQAMMYARKTPWLWIACVVATAYMAKQIFFSETDKKYS